MCARLSAAMPRYCECLVIISCALLIFCFLIPLDIIPFISCSVCSSSVLILCGGWGWFTYWQTYTNFRLSINISLIAFLGVCIFWIGVCLWPLCLALAHTRGGTNPEHLESIDVEFMATYLKGSLSTPLTPIFLCRCQHICCQLLTSHACTVMKFSTINHLLMYFPSFEWNWSSSLYCLSIWIGDV